MEFRSIAGDDVNKKWVEAKVSSLDKLRDLSNNPMDLEEFKRWFAQEFYNKYLNGK